jgi:hypothetical protein
MEMNPMNNVIDWDAFNKYWSPIVGVTQRVHLTNWRQEVVEFRGEKKFVLKFDVVAVDNKAFNTEKEFKVGGMNALLYQNIITELDSKGEKNLYIEIMRNNKKYDSIRVLPYVYDAVQRVR